MLVSCSWSASVFLSTSDLYEDTEIQNMDTEQEETQRSGNYFLQARAEIIERVLVVTGTAVFMAGGLCCTFGFLNNAMTPSFVGFALLLLAPVFVFALPSRIKSSSNLSSALHNQGNFNVLHVAVIPLGDDVLRNLVNDKPPDYESVAGTLPSYQEAIGGSVSSMSSGISSQHGLVSTVDARERVKRFTCLRQTCVVQ